jgi:cytosine/adenosine deaminase-related metal-dependent hydrolase
MFEEMRAALEVASSRARPIDGQDVWNMATTMGARSLGCSTWDLKVGYEGSLIGIEAAGTLTTEEVIAKGSPQAVRWIE